MMSASPQTSRSLGGSTLIGILGADELGPLVRAHHVPSDSTVAVRVVPRTDLQPGYEHHLEVLTSAAAVLAGEHPMALLLETGEVDDAVYLAGEFLPRGALTDLRPGVLAGLDPVGLIIPVVELLAAADRRGIHHGAFTGRSLRIDRYDQIAVVELGAAQLTRTVTAGEDLGALVDLLHSLVPELPTEELWGPTGPPDFDAVISGLRGLGDRGQTVWSGGPLDQKPLATDPGRRESNLLVTVGGEQRCFTAGQIVDIGRAVDALVPLNDRRISRQHLEVNYRQGQWVVSELGSSHGSRLDGEPFQELVVDRPIELELGPEARPLAVRLEVVG